MAVEERFHIHIFVNDKDELVVERRHHDAGGTRETLCSVALTAKDEPDYDPVFGDHTEVVVEAKEMRLEATREESITVSFGL